MTALRTNGVFDVDEVQFAVVETNGTVSVSLRPAYQPARRGDVTAAESEADPPQIIVADGALRGRTLHAMGLTRQWLDGVLHTHGLRLPEVFLMTADSSKTIRIIPKEGRGHA